MKTTFKLALAAIALVLTTGSMAQAQQKFGYINSQELIAAMPENEEINNRMEELRVELATQFNTMQEELANKTQDLQANLGTMSDAIRSQREKELQDLYTRIQEFQQMASEELQNRQIELYRPVFEKVQEVIARVGQEQSLVCVFDLASGALAWHNESQMVNVLPLAKRALNIQ